MTISPIDLNDVIHQSGECLELMSAHISLTLVRLVSKFHADEGVAI